MPNARRIDLGFTTADADLPTMSYDSGVVRLRFLDWRERPVVVTFRGVSRFEWTDEPDDFFPGEPPDGTCIVQKSGWIPPMAAVACQHYRLNFNACGGRLDVACVACEVADASEQ